MTTTDKVLISFFILLTFIGLWSGGLGLDESVLLVVGFVSGFLVLRKWLVIFFYGIIRSFKKPNESVIISTKGELKYKVIPGSFVIICSVFYFLLMFGLGLNSFFVTGFFFSWLVCGPMIFMDSYNESFFLPKKKEWS